MPKALQVKLLRFLEDHKVQRLGDTGVKAVDVRVIAATNKKGLPSVNAESLRRDLYYRLGEFEIDLPPLREREGDFLLIAEAIIARSRQRFGLPKLHLSPRTGQLLATYSWPGNVRELENKLSRAAIICENQTIEPEDLQLSAASFTELNFKDARDMFERDFVVNLLRRTDYNIAKAALQAGVSRPTLYDLLKKHNITIKTVSSAE